MEIRNGIIFFDTKAEFEAYVSDTNNVSITNYPVYIGDTKEIITHNVTYKDASEIDASQITSGTISVDRLPAGSLERCVVVANESARFALTTNDVQDGDTVKQSDTGVMYMVVDVNNLNSDAGYLTYTAVTNWESIANKPEFDYVKYSEQVLTAEQMLQARKNINAIGDVINVTFEEFVNLLSVGLIPFQEYRITDYCQFKYGDSAQHYDLIVKGTSNGWVSSQARAFWHEDPNNSYLWLIGMFSGPSFGVLGKYFGTAEEDGVVYHVWGANWEPFFRSETRYPEYGKYVESNGAIPIGEVSCPYFLLEDVTKWEIDINVNWKNFDRAALDVIRMRDTYGNEAPYDFKNVKISLRDITDAYTFSMLIDDVYYDASSTGINARGFIRPIMAHHNTIISSLYKDYNKNILITNDSTYDIKNNRLSDCYDNILVNSHDNYLYDCRNNQMDTVLNCSFDYCNSNVIDAASQSKFEGASSQNYSQMFNRFVSKNENDELVNINIPSAIEAKQEKLISGETIKTINNESLLGEGNIDIDVEHLIEVTYEELFEMQCLSKLTPGVKYRIVNYKPTILYPGASSSDIGFDIIVKALSKNKLDEDAKFIRNDTFAITSEIGSYEFLGRKEKCLEIEIDGGFALFTYIGCYYEPTLLEANVDSEYIFCWRCLNKETSDIVYSFTRHPKKDDIIYAGGGSGGPLPSYTVLTSEKLYHVMYPGTDEFIATDTVFIWSGLEKFTVNMWSVQRDYTPGLEKGIIKYVNPFDNTDVMNRFVVYHDVTLFEDNENVRTYRSLLQWERWFGNGLGYDNYSDSCFIGSETSPVDFEDLSVGSKHIAWTIGCGPYPIGECIIRGYSFEFRNRGFINYMKTARGDEANIDFLNTYFEQDPVLDLTFDKPNKIINSLYEEWNLQYQNIYEYPEQCFIPVGGGNIIEESSNVNISGNYNIIQYSEYVFFDNAWNNQILHSDNISFNGTNNTNNIINQCSKLTFNNWIYRSMFVHSIDRSFNEMVNNQYVIGKYDLDDFVSDPILNSTF